MVEYLPESGENPQTADERISHEAFFPVREQKLYFKNLEGGEGTFFDKELYSDWPCGATIELDRHFGILDIERRNVICCVTYDNYELIRNADAVEIARKHVIPEVFNGAGSQKCLCNGLLISNSRGQSYIDMCSYDYKPPVAVQDKWLPFMRITNSYNRSLKLTYRVGFCHINSGNRVIFSDRTINLDTIHKGVEEKIRKQVLVNFSDIKKFEKGFYDGLVSLNKYFFPKKRMLQMLCKVFGLTEKWAVGKRRDGTAARNHRIVCNVLQWTHEFFGASGDSAYAAFCVLTAFATRPPFELKRMMVGQIDRNQGIVGNWALDFVAKMAQPAFSTDDYLDEESVKAADTLVSDYLYFEKAIGMPDLTFGHGGGLDASRPDGESCGKISCGGAV